MTTPAFLTTSPQILHAARSKFQTNNLSARRPFSLPTPAVRSKARPHVTIVSASIASGKSNASMKRICVLSDGTWNTPEMEETTNIVKLTCAIPAQDESGTDQVLLYDEGVGTTGSELRKQADGAVGRGIEANIKQLYTFLSLNYNPGDEIYLFGFSRGAYTVRSLTGLLYHAGLVGGDQLNWVQEAYDLYRSDIPADAAEARQFRQAHGPRVPIKLLACFDTVGALGVPDNLDILGLDKGKFAFHDTTINNTIENAIHMLSIEEDKTTFLPTLMNASANVADQLTQKFFWGTHTGVGGGDKRQKVCATISLHFLVGEMKKRGLGLEIDENVLPALADFNTVIPEIEDGVFDGVVKRFTGQSFRDVPSVDWLHESALRRYQNVASWRPEALKPLHEAILAFKD